MSLPRPAIAIAIRVVHSAVFLVMTAAIYWLIASGLANRRDRSVAVAAGLVGAEAAVFVLNDHVCPLTPFAERWGAVKGSVSDIFLPNDVARTIPAWSTILLAIAGVLHLLGMLGVRGRHDRGE
jgi:hypothetical protein